MDDSEKLSKNDRRGVLLQPAGLATLPAALPYAGRSLPRRLAAVFHLACDQGELDIASQLVRMLEAQIETGRLQDPRDRRSLQDILVQAHQRLWHLRQARKGSARSD